MTATAAVDRPGPGGRSGFAPALALVEISVRFGGLTAVDSVSISVARGETVGLIGSNGAGKTTLMDCISGFVVPQEGVITVGDVELGDLAPELRPYVGLARSFQDARLFPGLTVEETLLVAMERHHPTGVVAALFGLSARARERTKRSEVDRLIDTLGLGAYRDKRISDLSTGTRRVVDIASVLIQEPSVLLLDEPTAGIAQRETEAFEPLMRRIREQLGCAILLIEHDMPLVMSLSDRIYAMEAGRVIAEGPPELVRTDPRVIASYLGTSPEAINRSDVGAALSRRAAPTPSKPGQRPAATRKASATKKAPARRSAPKPRG